jgi:hypothetical protein
MNCLKTVFTYSAKLTIIISFLTEEIKIEFVHHNKYVNDYEIINLEYFHRNKNQEILAMICRFLNNFMCEYDIITENDILLIKKIIINSFITYMGV